MKTQLAALCRRITAPITQVIFLLITSFLVVLIAYNPYTRFNSYENKTQLNYVTPALINEWGAEPSEVEVGLYINDFPEFDVIKNKFVFSGFAWFLFDPSLVSLDTIDKFSFSKADDFQKSSPETRLLDELMFARYIVRVTFKTDLNYKYFPLDDHTISISLVNKFVTPREIIFTSSIHNFNVDPNVYFAGWKLNDKNVTTGYQKAKLSDNKNDKKELYPKAVFSLDMKKFGMQGITLIFLPLFLVCFIALFSLAFDPAKQYTTILSLASTGIASLIAYRFVIQSVSPVPGYFMLSDQIFMFFLTFLFAVFMFSIILVSRNQLSDTLAIIRGVIFLLFHIIFLFWWYFLLHQWWF